MVLSKPNYGRGYNDYIIRLSRYAILYGYHVMRFYGYHVMPCLTVYIISSYIFL